jgi:hypothetical protein
MKKVLEFVKDLKQGPTEKSLLEMLGQVGVSPEQIERVCEQLRQRGQVTPALLNALNKIAAAQSSPAEQQRISKLLVKNCEGIITGTEQEELRRLVRAGERMNLKKAGALVALKNLTGDLPAWVRGERQ